MALSKLETRNRRRGETFCEERVGVTWTDYPPTTTDGKPRAAVFDRLPRFATIPTLSPASFSEKDQSS